MEIIKGYSQFDIDGIWFADDWGMQNTLMISPDMWRDFFKPRYKMQFDLVNSLGMDVIFHSCGYVRDIIPDLIEIGVDAFNLNQPRLLDINELANRFRGATCFICPVDMQTTMIKGTSEDIWREAEELVQKLGSAEGGFIACCDEGIDHGYVPMDNIREMGKAFEEYAFLAHTPAD